MGAPVLRPEINREPRSRENEEEEYRNTVCAGCFKKCDYADGNEEDYDVQHQHKTIKFPFELLFRRQVHYS